MRRPRAAVLLMTLLLAALPATPAMPASAVPPTASVPLAAPAEAMEPAAPSDDADDERDGPPSQAAYFAERLAEDPLYISDSVPRQAPRSAADAYTEQMARTGVPTYLMLLPAHLARPDGGGFLAAVHDRLGEDGLYVVVAGPTSSVTAEAYGVDLPAETVRTAQRAVLYELHYNTGTLASFTHFVDVLLSDDPGPRVEAAAAAYETSGPPSPQELRDRRLGQSVLTGLLITGVPVLLLGALARRRAATGQAPLTWHRGVPVAAGLAVLIAGTAPVLFAQERTVPDPAPTAADLDERLETVAAATREDPLHLHPELATVLGPDQRERVRERLAATDETHLVLALPLNALDESEGRTEHLAARLHELRGGEPAVYTLVDVEYGRLESHNYGVPKDFGSDVYAPHQREFEDHADLPGALESLLDDIAAAPAADPGEPPEARLELREADGGQALPPLYSPPLFLALPVGALLGWALLRGGDAALGGLRARRKPTRAGSDPLPPDAPARPSDRWLRRTALAELNSVTLEFDTASQNDSLPGPQRKRAWECLDSATLLLDLDDDGWLPADLPHERLIAAVALLRAARDALAAQGRQRTAPPSHFCALNPLHGPGHVRRAVSRDEGEREHVRAVCRRCAQALSTGGQAPRSVRPDRLLLRVPLPQEDGTSGPRHGPYHRTDGLLGSGHALGLPVDRLIDAAKEDRGVH